MSPGYTSASEMVHGDAYTYVPCLGDVLTEAKASVVASSGEYQDVLRIRCQDILPRLQGQWVLNNLDGLDFGALRGGSGGRRDGRGCSSYSSSRLVEEALDPFEKRDLRLFGDSNRERWGEEKGC